jgi:hypothetical protein
VDTVAGGKLIVGKKDHLEHLVSFRCLGH